MSTLGTLARSDQVVAIDVDRLVEARLLVQANSGGGKSWALRRILEQTHGHLQQIVLDVEGDFYTLREHHDFILARAGTTDERDCPADPRSAHILARKLLELGVSAIVDIYELHAEERYAFVRRFLEAMLGAPRSLWHPALVVVDEAHLFCPQTGSNESAAAVIDLMTRGRKRGFAGLLASQRLSKLHKDAAAECNTKLIGRTALDVDMKRAGEELGFDKKSWPLLRDLPAGTFYAFGPAISSQVIEVEVGEVRTTHPKSGQRSPATPPPRGRVQEVLGELQDLPAVAAEEVRTVTALDAQVRDLKRELATLQARAHVPADVALERERSRGIADGQKLAEELEREVRKRFSDALRLVDQVLDETRLERLLHLIEQASALLIEVRAVCDPVRHSVLEDLRVLLAGEPFPAALQLRPATPPAPPPPKTFFLNEQHTEHVSRGEARRERTDRAGKRHVHHERDRARVERVHASHGKVRALRTLAQMFPARLTEARWATLATLKRSGGTWQKYVRELREEGLAEESGGTWCATPQGLSAAGEVPAAPRTPKEHLDMWAEKPGMRNAIRIAELVLQHGAVTRRDLARAVGLEVSGGTFQGYVRLCAGAGLVEVAGETVHPGECLR